MTQRMDPLAHLSPQEIEAKLLAAWNVPDLASLTKLPEYQAALRTFKNPGQAAKIGMRFKTERADLAGFYAGMAERTNWNKGTRSRDVVARGPRILFTNGQALVPWGPADAEDYPAAVMDRVVVEGCRLRNDVFLERQEITMGKDAVVKKQDHEGAVPEVPIKKAIERCWERNKERGTIRGDTGDFPILASLTITDDPRDISLFEENRYKPEEGPTLRAVARDVEGTVVRGKLPISYVCEQYGLPEDATREDFQNALRGEPTLVNCKVGIFHPRDITGFRSSEEVHAKLQELQDNQQLRPYGKHGKMMLCLKDTMVDSGQKDENGEPILEQAACIEICGVNVYDIQQKYAGDGPDGPKYEWSFSVLATEQKNGVPWFSVKESANEETGRVFNEGAFVVFLNTVGGRPLAVDDPFAEMGRKLEDFVEEAPVAAPKGSPANGPKPGAAKTVAARPAASKPAGR